MVPESFWSTAGHEVGQGWMWEVWGAEGGGWKGTGSGSALLKTPKCAGNFNLFMGVIFKNFKVDIEVVAV